MTMTEKPIFTTAAPGGRAASTPLVGDEREPTLFELSVPGENYRISPGTPGTS